MHVAYIVVTVAAIVANAGVAIADLLGAQAVLSTSAEVGVPRSWLPVLAVPKAAGAAGLLLGLLGAHVIGVMAAAGLVVFFLGAVGAHVRARVFYNIAFPGAFLALAGAALVLAVV